jgi:hypothetical protein
MFDDAVDILEVNPYYRQKIPPAPVVHRRTSIEWEVFGDGDDIREISKYTHFVSLKHCLD